MLMMIDYGISSTINKEPIGFFHSWTRKLSWGFFAAGIGFLIVGAVMLFIGGKNFIKRDKEKRAMEEAAMAEEKAAEPEKTIEKKTMSIAERARLASSLEESESEDKTEKPDESETADIASEEKTEE